MNDLLEKEGYLKRDELIEIDKNIKLIPLTYDKMLKSVFTFNLDI